jgi:hypothetical protein
LPRRRPGRSAGTAPWRAESPRASCWAIASSPSRAEIRLHSGAPRLAQELRAHLSHVAIHIAFCHCRHGRDLRCGLRKNDYGRPRRPGRNLAHGARASASDRHQPGHAQSAGVPALLGGDT